MKNEVVVIAFIPVIHRGYLDFLQQSGAKRVYVVGAHDVPEMPHIAREVRALSFEEVSTILQAYGFIVEWFYGHVSNLLDSSFDLLMPNDDVSRTLYAKHFQGRSVSFVETFLRWDWNKSVEFKPAIPDADRIIKKEARLFCSTFGPFTRTLTEAAKSSDWWRQVGAMAVCRNGDTIIAYNKHFPHEYAPYFDGDPRNNFAPGEFIEISTALHAEIAVLAEAAKRGISLDAAEWFVTTFPCCGCASAVAVSGARRVFFSGGYSNLNGVKTLRDKQIELIYVEC